MEVDHPCEEVPCGQSTIPHQLGKEEKMKEKRERERRRTIGVLGLELGQNFPCLSSLFSHRKPERFQLQRRR